MSILDQIAGEETADISIAGSCILWGFRFWLFLWFASSLGHFWSIQDGRSIRSFRLAFLFGIDLFFLSVRIRTSFLSACQSLLPVAIDALLLQCSRGPVSVIVIVSMFLEQILSDVPGIGKVPKYRIPIVFAVLRM